MLETRKMVKTGDTIWGQVHLADTCFLSSPTRHPVLHSHPPLPALGYKEKGKKTLKRFLLELGS